LSKHKPIVRSRYKVSQLTAAHCQTGIPLVRADGLLRGSSQWVVDADCAWYIQRSSRVGQHLLAGRGDRATDGQQAVADDETTGLRRRAVGGRLLDRRRRWCPQQRTRHQRDLRTTAHAHRY